MDGAGGLPTGVSFCRKCVQRCMVLELMVGHRAQFTARLCDPFFCLLGTTTCHDHQGSLLIQYFHIKILEDHSVFYQSSFYLYPGAQGSRQTMASYGLQNYRCRIGGHCSILVNWLVRTYEHGGDLYRATSRCPWWESPSIEISPWLRWRVLDGIWSRIPTHVGGVTD